jgi:serine phosphatase RsbU (regulator of sigma subunit)
MRTYSLPNIHWHPELDYNAFCQCAYEHTGNFYDFIPQDGSCLAISFGDLPSAGDAQSINLPCLQALVRGLSAGSRDDLAGMARELNGTLYLLGPQGLCAPWFYARIDPVRHQLQYVNAGHEPPLLVRQNGTVRRLERTGAALGLSARGVHRCESLAIEPGEILAIYSEALAEQTVLEVVLDHPHASTAELAQRVLEASRRVPDRPWMGEDRTFAAVRLVDAYRHPLMEECAENLAMCAA